jgi:hypothetical protein
MCIRRKKLFLLMYTNVYRHLCVWMHAMLHCVALDWIALHCMFVCMHGCMCTCVHVFFCMYLSMYVRTSTHMRMHGKEDTCIDLPNV